MHKKKFTILLFTTIIFLAMSYINIIPFQSITSSPINKSIPKSSGTYSNPWENGWGGSYSDSPCVIETDSMGNCFVIGRYDHNTGSADEFFELHKISSDGAFAWNKTWLESVFRASAVMIDSENTIYLAGWTSSDDVRIFKYNTAGVIISNNLYDLSDDHHPYKMKLDSNNNLYVAGIYYWSTLPEGLIMRFNDSTVFDWEKQWTRSSPKVMTGGFWALDINSNDEVFTVGFTRDFNTYDHDVLVVKYSEDGTKQWDKWWGSPSVNEDAYGIVIDSADNLYIVSNENLTKLNENGDWLWSKTLTSSAIEYYSYSDITTNAQGELIIAGRVKYQGNSEEKLIIAYDSNGNYKWNVSWGPPKSTMSYSNYISLDECDNMWFLSSYNFDSSDILLYKFSNLDGCIEDDGANNDDNLDPIEDSIDGFSLGCIFLVIGSITIRRYRGLRRKIARTPAH